MMPWLLMRRYVSLDTPSACVHTVHRYHEPAAHTLRLQKGYTQSNNHCITTIYTIHHTKALYLTDLHAQHEGAQRVPELHRIRAPEGHVGIRGPAVQHDGGKG